MSFSSSRRLQLEFRISSYSLCLLFYNNALILLDHSLSNNDFVHILLTFFGFFVIGSVLLLIFTMKKENY